MKPGLFFLCVTSISLILQSCATKLDVCECLSLKNALTDQFLLSEKEQKRKEEGCKWIYEEYSDLELLQKWAECNGSKNQQEPEKPEQAPQDENANRVARSGEYSVYYPVTPEGNYDKSELSFYYYPNENGNRPYAEFRFTDGTKFDLTPVCEGEYSWCIRTAENLEIGYLKVEPDSEGEAVFLYSKFNENSSNYTYYLEKMSGTFRLLEL